MDQFAWVHDDEKYLADRNPEDNTSEELCVQTWRRADVISMLFLRWSHKLPAFLFLVANNEPATRESDDVEFGLFISESTLRRGTESLEEMETMCQTAKSKHLKPGWRASWRRQGNARNGVGDKIGPTINLRGCKATLQPSTLSRRRLFGAVLSCQNHLQIFY